MIKSALSPSLQRLVSTLSKLGLTGQEIAEAIWLVEQTGDAEIITIDVPGGTTISEDGKAQDEQEPEPPSNLNTDTDNQSSPPPAEIVPSPVEKTSSLKLPPNYKPIPVPDAPAISQALLLAQALRPLARQFPVGRLAILDETATVDLIAKTGLWQPVLKSKSELWLDMALVFDTSPSMCLWQRLGVDVYRLLSRYGEFRDVRIWRLQHTAGKVELTCRKGVPHKPSELLTGDRRRLIVVVSDCVAPA